MKTVIALFVISLPLAVIGCRENQRAHKSDNAAAPASSGSPQSDKGEILTRHLLRRLTDANEEITILRGEMIKRDNKRLQEEIDTLEVGRLPRAIGAKGRAD